MQPHPCRREVELRGIDRTRGRFATFRTRGTGRSAFGRLEALPGVERARRA
jgi:hypothetical protein